MIDPFTAASPTYQAAIRHPHKTGAAFEGYGPRPLFPPLLGRFLARGVAVLIVVGGLAWFLLWAV